MSAFGQERSVKELHPIPVGGRSLFVSQTARVGSIPITRSALPRIALVDRDRSDLLTPEPPQRIQRERLLDAREAAVRPRRLRHSAGPMPAHRPNARVNELHSA
jgi:hypothetical protein